MADQSAALATQETYKDAVKNKGDEVRLWLDALEIASKDEKDWREDAQKAVNLYRQDRDDGKSRGHKKFNILHSNIETILPALYNSTPVPDVRRRFNDPDPIAKIVADVQERAISYSVESYDFDSVIRFASEDMELTGRGVSRIRYLPYLAADDQIAFQEVQCEPVQWKHFRRGPGNIWGDVPWVAFELFLTRDQLTKLSPKLGGEVTLDTEIAGTGRDDGGRNTPEIFKRARVWEIWDKDRRKVLFVATGYKAAPIREEDDPLQLQDFFPIPRPIYAIQTSNSLVPIVPYEIYKAQAEELERVSQRIQVLTEAVKAKAIYDGRMTEMERLTDEDDAALVPVENVSVFAEGAGLKDKIFFWPIEVIVAALEKLYLARDQIKQTIYELTGISDILRGDSNPNETLGAQQIKTQWGSLRIQRKQAEIQRFARDIFRMKAELFASKFQPHVLEMMTGISLTPQQTDDPQTLQKKQAVLQLLQSDTTRGFRVDVESDSTIRADMTRNQQNMNLFLQGTAMFAQSMGPIVMQEPQVLPAAMEVFSAFARNFKLGKQAEAALDALADKSQQIANQPKPPPPELAIKQAELQQQAQVAQWQQQIDQSKVQQEGQHKTGMLQLEQAKIADESKFKREKLNAEHNLQYQMHLNEMAQADKHHAAEQVTARANPGGGQSKKSKSNGGGSTANQPAPVVHVTVPITMPKKTGERTIVTEHDANGRIKTFERHPIEGKPSG